MINAPWILNWTVVLFLNIGSILDENYKKELAKDWPRQDLKLKPYLVYQKYLVKSSLFWKFIQTIPSKNILVTR